MDEQRRRADDLTPEEEKLAAQFEAMSQQEKNEFYRRLLDVMPISPPVAP